MVQRADWSGPKDLVLWDGDCHFCGHAVRWFERRDRRGVLEFVPYQQAPSPLMTPHLRAACAAALHVITPDGQVLRAGKATLFMLEKIGWAGLARVLAFPPFVWFVELGYAFVAANRSVLSRLLRILSSS
jgi:predicted DCC family thiol-disulfide oxidoreductase YuxK